MRAVTWRRAILPLLPLALLLLVVVVPLPAAACPEWSTPVDISGSPGASQEPAIAIDSNGTTHVVWQDKMPGVYEVFYACKPSDGSWSVPIIISPDDTNASQYPDIAIDGDDNLHVVWQDDTALGTIDIYYINKTAGGPWSSAVVIYSDAAPSRWPAIAIDNDDNLHVVWHDQEPGSYEIYYSMSMDGGSTWLPPAIISGAPGSYAAAIAIDSEDNLHVVWQHIILSKYEIYYATKPSGDPWSTPVNISKNSGDSLYPAIATDNNNNLHVVWEDTTPGNYEILYSISMDGGLTWSTQVNISNSDDSSVFPDIAADSNNGLHVVWSDWTPGNLEVYYASKPSDGSWSAPENISNSEDDSNTPAIAIDNHSRNLRVVWSEQVAALDWEIMYSSAALPEEAAEGGLSWPVIVGIAVGGVAAAAGIYFFTIRRWLKPGPV